MFLGKQVVKTRMMRMLYKVRSENKFRGGGGKKGNIY
jgi:hypothetical protein